MVNLNTNTTQILGNNIETKNQYVTKQFLIMQAQHYLHA